MGKVLATLALASVAVAANPSPPPRSALPSRLVQATKKLAAKDCRPNVAFGGDLYVSRCVYLPPAFVDGQWGVMVHFVLVDRSGKFVAAQGSDAVYVFNKTGKFVKIIPGM